MKYCSNGCKVLSLVVISLSFTCGQIQCPSAPVTVFSNGTADFDSLPAGADDVEPVYDSGPIGGWYSLAGGFVDAVRPGSLPYNQIREALEDSGLPCDIFPQGRSDCSATASNQDASFDVQNTLRSFATWWVGLIIVTIIGGLLACGFCISGICFCCCRCCGNCGGKKTQQISENMDCKAFTFTIILLLFLAVLFAGVVLAFFSNQQTYDSVENTQATINRVVSVGTDYINDTIDELEQLVCQFASTDGIAGNIIGEANNFNTTLQDYITDLEGEVDEIGRIINTVSPGYNRTLDVLGNLSSISTSLMTSGNMLIVSLQSITMTLDNVRAQCDDANPMIAACSQLTSTMFQSGADFTQLPSVQQPLNDINNAIQNINFENLVSEGRQTFDTIRQNIDEGVSSNLAEGIRQVDSYNKTLFEIVDNVTRTVREYIEDTIVASQCPEGFFEVFDESNLQTNVGYIRECIINRAFSEIQEYDTYRYAFGVVICSLALVTVIVALIGILLGMLGFRKNKDPDQRTTLSHCGGVFLILGVIITFVFGFILLILCCIFFFFGANVQKLCQSVEYPDYPLYEELVDNTSFWGGSLLGEYFPNDPNNPNTPQIFISEALRECQNNTGLYTAANLSLLLPSGSISQEINTRVNLDEIRINLNNALRDATRDFNFNSTSFLPVDVQRSLEDVRNSSVDQINITAFREQIEAPLLMFNITEEIGRFMSLRNSLVMLPADPTVTNIITMVDSIITELNMINTNIPAIRGQVNVLEAEVDQLVNLVDTVVMETIQVVEEIGEVIDNITGQSLPNFLDTEVAGALNQVFGLLNMSIDHVEEELSTNVGGCFPLWSIYTQLYGTACEDFVDGLNGFWWSLGFCGLLFIPVIIFSIITSNYYLKKKNEVEGGYSGYDDYPMKSY